MQLVSLMNWKMLIEYATEFFMTPQLLLPDEYAVIADRVWKSIPELVY